MRPVVIDGIAYALIAIFGFLTTAFASDEAAKFIAPATLFWLRTAFGALSAGAFALKAYRSTTFAAFLKNAAPSETTNNKTESPK